MEKLESLIRILSRGGFWRGEEIQRELGISQPVMSRLVREAGPRICRFGRSVATRYALPREIAGVGRQAPVFRVDEQGHPTRHGVLHFLARDGYWLERESAEGQAFSGLPSFVEDMRPQGYIGRCFPAYYPELKLPGRISDWNEDHQLIALSLRGEDCVGNLIIGEESLGRFFTQKPKPCGRDEYPRRAAGVLSGQPGSSAGGEHPKFAVYSGGRHVIVKFASGDGAAADRWRDLLICEHIALEVLGEAGFPIPHSEWFDLDGIRFLQVERFDRVGRQGRRGVISLFALNNRYLGDYPDSWSRASRRILEEPSLSLSAEDADRIIWLDSFGDLIGNTDRHHGNLTFFAEEARELTLTLAPVYDMLPMLFAPAGTDVVEKPFTPGPPSALNLHVWHEVARHTQEYWARLCDENRLGASFRRIAGECRKKLDRLVAGT